MTTEDELYEAVLAAPDRDGPRRRYARHLEAKGDELGEFIRLALDWDRKRLTGAADTRALVLYNQLLDRLAAPVKPWVRSFQLDRGLVALVEMDGKAFVEVTAGTKSSTRARVESVLKKVAPAHQLEDVVWNSWSIERAGAGEGG